MMSVCLIVRNAQFVKSRTQRFLLSFVLPAAGQSNYLPGAAVLFEAHHICQDTCPAPPCFL